MAQGNPLPGEKYLHFKNRLYQVMAVAYHSETMEPYVVYQALYGDYKTYIRPYDMFVGEVDHEKYPEVSQRYRFQYISDTDLAQPSDSDGCAEEQSVPEPVVQSGFEPEGQSVPEPVEQVPAGVAEESEGQMNPWLEKFLDAKGFEEKYRIVCDMQRDVTDRLIDDIAVVMDLAIPEGDLKERYGQLKYCMRTRQKYEMGRLRR
ncbi:MAG: DUF1653 domain-containing protein [Clostridiales bacterium]|nr:DUF1653 domain-containing protein [Clostridiales bacterium]